MLCICFLFVGVFVRTRSPCWHPRHDTKSFYGVPVISIRPLNIKMETCRFVGKWKFMITSSSRILIFLRNFWPFRSFKFKAKMGLQTPISCAIFSHTPYRAPREQEISLFFDPGDPPSCSEASRRSLTMTIFIKIPLRPIPSLRAIHENPGEKKKANDTN